MDRIKVPSSGEEDGSSQWQDNIKISQVGEDHTHSKRDRVSCREKNGLSKGANKIKILQAKDKQQISSYSGKRMVPANERTG